MENTIRKPKVLYVDDEENNLHVFRSSFRRLYDIYTACSAREGKELLVNNPVDVIISDQRMPTMSGVEFLKSLPDGAGNIKMIMTGYSDIEAVIEALNGGKIQHYIRKPWAKEELKQVIEEQLSKVNDRKIAGTDGLVTAPSQDRDERSDKGTRSQPDDQSEEVKMLKHQVQEAYNNVQLLGEIGQEISSTLNLANILNTVYEYVNQLMDANVFGIGIYNAENSTIDYQLAIEKGKKYQPYSRTMEDKEQFPVWCIENKKEIFINDVNKEYSRYIKDFTEIVSTLEDGSKSETAQSFIYMPLMIKDKVIGLITVQSFDTNAYSEYHLNTLRNIGIFVATALENAKAYTLIEEQKTEIEHKNAELEQKVEQRTEELRLQKDELEDTFSKLKLLTEIGKEITSTLHLDTILNTIYENINSLMDASVFGIGIYREEEKVIDYRLAIEKGKRYQPYKRTMEDKNQFPVWCIENKKEIFINDVEKEYSRYIGKYEHKIVILEDGTQSAVPLSFIYIPLLFNNQPIGVLSVQSFRKYAYNQYHLDILRSLASYITTAIQNANSYSKMTEAFEQLKAAQTKLVESEKMASLGVLTAGVAHEINNPVNFISGGIESLKENYLELKQLLLHVSNHDGTQSAESMWNEVVRFSEEIELPGILKEMDILINTIQNGASRTSEIVKGLRNFSRLDESDMKKAGMEDGINNTLVIINNKLKDRVKVVKEFGDIPMIICYPGQLNQVFMNILYNAADAIEAEGEIYIKTWQENEMIHILFRDSGCGMPDHVKEHIFEPFFTTKPVGKGTGLGLSISYGIIEAHKGKIEVRSEVGKGTEFIISLPIQI